MIHKAKVKSSYAKLKSREPQLHSHVIATNKEEISTNKATSTHPHPARQAIIDDAALRDIQPGIPGTTPNREHRSKQKTVPFAREARSAEQRKSDAETRRLEIEAAQYDRERTRRAMAKARQGGKNGQRKLGRESKILLERVQKMMEAGK